MNLPYNAEHVADNIVEYRLANLAAPSLRIKFKKSTMPFMQMENISHFLRACESPPLSLPSHDRFLTVDLYENKDPAQVIQCLGAFSRIANSISPSKFPTTIGPKKAGVVSPTRSGFAQNSIFGGGFSALSSSIGNDNNPVLPQRNGALPTKALSPTVTGSSASSRTQEEAHKSPSGPVSSWSKKGDEGNTAPAWNINQYGFMGGASQGNQGIAFGGRRQITSAGPHVTGVAEKERKRKEEQQAEKERLRIQEEEAEAERRRRMEQEAADARAKIEEENRRLEEERRIELERQQMEEWRKEDEARKVRELERQRAQKEEQEWRLQEIRRKKEASELQEQREIEEKRKREVGQKRPGMDSRLRGQFLSQYQAEQVEQAGAAQTAPGDKPLQQNPEQDRLRELERQLEEVKERERQYIREREALLRKESEQAFKLERGVSAGNSRTEGREQTPDESEVSWVAGDERDYLRQQWKEHQNGTSPVHDNSNISNPPLPIQNKPFAPTFTPLPLSSASRPLPDPKSRSPFHRPTRPLPNPSEQKEAFTKTEISQSTEKGSEEASNPVSAASSSPYRPPERNFPFKPGRTSAESRRSANQQQEQQQASKPKASGWASKSLLEREMERERERQREWEEAQKRTKEAKGNPMEGSREGQSWDVNQYGWLGGDSQNKVGSGIGFSGRRQIIGPRPAP